MKKISTKALVPGMVLAKNVFTSNMNKLIDAGTILTQVEIAKLAFYSIDEVDVEEDATDQLLSDSTDDQDLTSFERIRQSQEFKEFKSAFEACAQKFENDINDIVMGQEPVDTAKLLTPIYALLKKGKTTADVFTMLHNLRDYDDATYTHSMNVALSSNILAQWLKFDEEEIETATLAGLFHDIGKISIPESIITKPAKLDEYEMSIVRTHPQKGYDIIKDLDIGIHVKNACLMHHERCDGSGYPSKYEGPQIDKFAKLVAITDVYDAMTSARHYRKPLCPFIALQNFEDEGFLKYDTEMIMCFLQNIVNTYLLATVRLNTGETGEIVFINKTYLAKPTVKIGRDYIDLSKLKNVYIEEVL